MHDYHLQEQEREYQKKKRKFILWEAANLMAKEEKQDDAIAKSEELFSKIEQAAQNQEAIDDGNELVFLDKSLNGTNAEDKTQAIAIYHKVCEEEGIDSKPYPFLS